MVISLGISCAQLSFDVGVVTIFGRRLDQRFKEELRKNYFVVEKGYNSFPNCLPGSRYQKAIQVCTYKEDSFFTIPFETF